MKIVSFKELLQAPKNTIFSMICLSNDVVKPMGLHRKTDEPNIQCLAVHAVPLDKPTWSGSSVDINKVIHAHHADGSVGVQASNSEQMNVTNFRDYLFGIWEPQELKELITELSHTLIDPP